MESNFKPDPSLRSHFPFLFYATMVLRVSMKNDAAPLLLRTTFFSLNDLKCATKCR